MILAKSTVSMSDIDLSGVFFFCFLHGFLFSKSECEKNVKVSFTIFFYTVLSSWCQITVKYHTHKSVVAECILLREQLIANTNLQTYLVAHI